MWVEATGSTFFVVGNDRFADLEIRRAKEGDPFFYFFDTKQNRLITHFVLDDLKPNSRVCCQVKLIQKGDKFTPRLELSKRQKPGKELIREDATSDDTARRISSRVDLDDCYEQFWQLISFLQSLDEVEVPEQAFSLIGKDDAELIRKIQSERDPDAVLDIAKSLVAASGAQLRQTDINLLLKRKEKLITFEKGLAQYPNDEGKWQTFFNANKWIFGYGLNYQIIGIEQDQPHYGGTRFDRKGGEKGDYLGATKGDLRFTVLVEIKTPAAPLLKGKEEIRSGAWSLSQDLTDAVAQLQGNIQRWELEGSKTTENRDILEAEKIFTVRPPGILVVGQLTEFEGSRTKWETFQRFRAHLHGIDILTFDELLERARFIVEQQE